MIDVVGSIDTKGESYAHAGATTKTGKTLRKGANWDFSMVDLPTLKTSKSNAQGILSQRNKMRKKVIKMTIQSILFPCRETVNSYLKVVLRSLLEI